MAIIVNSTTNAHNKLIFSINTDVTTLNATDSINDSTVAIIVQRCEISTFEPGLGTLNFFLSFNFNSPV